ncbi:hypothetical protein [Agreia pratensis]|uniref:hypothetical protein n=1 Tax=Agreia pratensis TaxID=150121 RepID=UPI000A1CC09A|nr:hypothetical protein [Agreia pratensis]
MLAEPPSLNAIMVDLAELFRPSRPDVILGIEANGFVRARAVAATLGIGFVPVRKKLQIFPGDVIRRITNATRRRSRPGEISYGRTSVSC